MSDIAIKLENVSKYYKLYDSPKERLKEALHPFGRKYHKRFYALRNINLEIKKGEILGVVGRNGSGKSTLLKIISRVLQPSSGKALVRGSVSALLELNSGLNPDFTGMQNIHFSGTMQGFSRKEMDEKVDDIVSFADIGQFIHQPLKTYSSGMKARLGFAIAINMEPEILVLDEVLSVGDELFKRKCYAKMEEFFNSGCTVLFVSHSVDSVIGICSRAILLDDGEKILAGSPKSVTMHYQRYIHSKPEDKPAIRQELVEMKVIEDVQIESPTEIMRDSEDVKPMGADTSVTVETDTNNVESEAAASLANKKEAKKENLGNQVNEAEKEKEDEENVAFFLPEFKSKSRIVHKHYDVDIFDVHIRTPEGQKVNVLVTNHQYIYSYKVKSGIDFGKVNFGMGIKSEKGEHLSWMMHPGMDDYVEDLLEKDSIHLVEWRFTCRCLPGNYYCSAGLRGFKDGIKVVLYRVDDELVFKVRSGTKKQKGGFYDSGQYVESIQRIG